MTVNLLILVTLAAVSVIALSSWPTARVIFLESILHPLRQSTIRFDSNGKVTVKPNTDEQLRWDDRKDCGEDGYPDDDRAQVPAAKAHRNVTSVPHTS